MSRARQAILKTSVQSLASEQQSLLVRRPVHLPENEGPLTVLLRSGL